MVADLEAELAKTQLKFNFMPSWDKSRVLGNLLQRNLCLFGIIIRRLERSGRIRFRPGIIYHKNSYTRLEDWAILRESRTSDGVCERRCVHVGWTIILWFLASPAEDVWFL